MPPIAPSPETQPSLWIRMAILYGVPTFCCPYCPMWFQKPGHFKNHLSKQHTAALARDSILLMSSPPENPSPLQLQNNTTATSGLNIMSPTPVPGSSQASAAPPTSNPVAFPSTHFAIASPPQFSPQPQASSRNQRFTPASQASSMAPPPPAPHAPSHQAQNYGSSTLHGAFQPQNHAMYMMNGGIASPGMPAPQPPSNDPFGNTPTQDSFDFDEWLREVENGSL
ncbi:hypothetical protein F4811DRAFT_3601 [Daldinia bambusicola]|nr:hypothetical protein F4811DRAFT_3601 [Daldinia bambusicola]